MRARETISSGIAASAIAHLSGLMLVLLFTEVHTFSSVTAEPITVDLISQPEAAPSSPKVEDSPPDQTRQSSDAVGPSTNSAASSSKTPAPSNAAASEKQPPLPKPDQERKEAAV